MTPEMKRSADTAEKAKAVKAAWDDAPAGANKDAALKRHEAAGKG